MIIIGSWLSVFCLLITNSLLLKKNLNIRLLLKDLKLIVKLFTLNLNNKVKRVKRKINF